MIDDKQNEQNKKAALRLLEETNKALGLPTPEGDPILSANAQNRAKFGLGGLKAAVTQFHRLRDEGIGATLAADIWKAWKRPGAWSGKK